MNAAAKSLAKRMAQWLAVSALLLVLLLAVGYQVLRSNYQNFLQQPLGISAAGQVFIVDPGMSGRAVVNRLQKAGITEWNWQWRWLMRQQPDPLKAGEYRL